MLTAEPQRTQRKRNKNLPQRHRDTEEDIMSFSMPKSKHLIAKIGKGFLITYNLPLCLCVFMIFKTQRHRGHGDIYIRFLLAIYLDTHL